jgi:hypothetical protein
MKASHLRGVLKNRQLNKTHVTAPHVQLDLARGPFCFLRKKFVSSCRYFDPIHSYDLKMDDDLGVNISHDSNN